MAALAPDAIVETGTWLGNTTGYMAETSQAPVYSCDVDPRFHAIAKMRLAQVEGIHLHLSDSREFLRDLINSALRDKSVFFYLDAHWTDDVPLLGELELIANHWRLFVVMVDDFKVPDDPGYGYDDYGSGRALVLETLEPSLAKYDLVAYFPAAHSREETGRRRGSILLAPRGDFSERLSHLESLRQAWVWFDPSGGHGYFFVVRFALVLVLVRFAVVGSSSSKSSGWALTAGWVAGTTSSGMHEVLHLRHRARERGRGSFGLGHYSTSPYRQGVCHQDADARSPKSQKPALARGKSGRSVEEVGNELDWEAEPIGD
jgi:hypothetical protein